MGTAYILLNVDPGHEDEVLGAVRVTQRVSEAHRIYGIYDTIVKVMGNSDEIKGTIMLIRGLKHIKSTLTLTVIE
ncbi:MAG: Lrp/AsnC ligand binding domain-containing protein [Nitrososphaerales archaeon]